MNASLNHWPQGLAGLNLGLLKYSNQTFQLLAYEFEHVFQGIFFGSIELLFCNFLKRTVLQKCINQDGRLAFNSGFVIFMH